MNKSEYSFSTFIGIDVAKNKIDIFEQKLQTFKTVGNNKHEISVWIKTLAETDQAIVIMEACKRRRETVALGGEWRAVELCSAQMFSC